MSIDQDEPEIANRSPARPGQPYPERPVVDTHCMSLHSQDPLDIVAAAEEAGHRVRSVVASMRASWMRDALCAEFDIDLWFPAKGQRNTQAMEICGRCPVRIECLDDALDDDSLDHGIRGGMTVQARRVARRERTAGRRR